MNKKKLVISYKNLSPELIALVKKKYPHGYHDHVIKVTKPNNDFFYAITLDTDEASYLIKVNVKIDTKPKDDDDEKGFFSDSDSIGTDEDSFPDEVEDEQDEDYSDDD
ncbi:MAG: hypothetical protein PHT92_03600 [Bacteroidales bacterium]|jgi:hypothetical protein|nr:hypothetical protein [Bacteroidales bacterium]MDY0252853.1 hypothetical protein [Tenuifilaceae bacterium]